MIRDLELKPSENGKAKDIFILGFDDYLRSINYKIRSSALENVKKMLACRTDLLGYHEYICTCCGDKKKVPHSCKSRFCNSCGRVAMEKWIASRFGFFLNCYYHHLVFTIPFGYRKVAMLSRDKVLNLQAKCAAETVMQWAKNRGCEVGIISFFHSFGAKLQFHPHFHILVTSGGIDKDGNWKQFGEEIPGQILMKIFKAKFTAEMKKQFKTAWIRKTIKKCYKEHWQVYAKRVLTRGKDTLLYCVRYGKKMVLSEKRIIQYDENEVTFESGKIDGTKRAITYSLNQFIKCVVQHIPEKGFRLIRYYGFYANRSKKKYEIARRHWDVLQPASKAPTWWVRRYFMNGEDPLRCKKCNMRMKVHKAVFAKPIIRTSLVEVMNTFLIEKESALNVSYG